MLVLCVRGSVVLFQYDRRGDSRRNESYGRRSSRDYYHRGEPVSNCIQSVNKFKSDFVCNAGLLVNLFTFEQGCFYR